MVPALGVTEPGAIAFCVAKARSFTSGEPLHVHVTMNSGMYKNAFTCGIPGSDETGNVFAAALGLIAGDAGKGLQSLAGAGPADHEAVRKLIDEGKVTVEMSGINGATPEETMRNMGLIASPGMVGTEKTIVEILQGKMQQTMI